MSLEKGFTSWLHKKYEVFISYDSHFKAEVKDFFFHRQIDSPETISLNSIAGEWKIPLHRRNEYC